MSDNNNADSSTEEPASEEQLQRELEKQIGLFARIFAMLDTDSDGEQHAALKKLTRNMQKINDLQESLTGTRGTLSFGSLLEKIENGGGGGNEQIADYEQLIAEYQAANETLKQAESLLRAELERRELLDKYGKANKIEDIDLGALTKKTLSEVKTSLDSLQKIMGPDSSDLEGIYTAVLDEMVGKDIGANGEKPKMKHRLFSGILRGMNYPVDADDAVKLQVLAATQAQMLKDTEALQEKITTLRESLPALQEALDIAIYQSGEHPDLARAVKEMQAAMRQVQQLRYENNELIRAQAQMRAQYEEKIRTRDHTIASVTHQLNRLDTRMLELLNDVDGGKNPVAAKTDAKGKPLHDFAKRAADYRKEAIDWSNNDALRARISAVAVRGYKMRAGDTFHPVTLDDVLRENHALHAFQLRQKKDARGAAREGNKILSTYRLLPQGELDSLLEGNQRLRDDAVAARTETGSVRRQLKNSESDRVRLQNDAQELRKIIDDKNVEITTLTTDKTTLETELNVLKTQKGPSTVMHIAVGMIAGVFMAAAVGMVLNKTAANDVPLPEKSAPTQSVNSPAP